MPLINRLKRFADRAEKSVKTRRRGRIEGGKQLREWLFRVEATGDGVAKAT